MNGHTDPASFKPTRVTCPGCGGDSLYASANPFRPFCSERCKNMDLGAWASESFRMPAKDTGDELTNGLAEPK